MFQDDLYSILVSEYQTECLPSPISEFWIYTTMLVEDEWQGLGTGFLVFREDTDKKFEGNIKEGRIFFITNKHVLNPNSDLRQNATMILLHLNIKNTDGTITRQEAEVSLKLDDGSKRWREHPDRDVDVMAIDITQLLVDYPQIEKQEKEEAYLQPE